MVMSRLGSSAEVLVPKVTPERFCVLQHGSRVDGLPEVDDGILTSVVIVGPEARRAEPPRLLYAALRGSCALGLASSNLRHASRSDRPASRAAASRTNPATTGTAIATAASRETRRAPARPTSLTVICGLLKPGSYLAQGGSPEQGPSGQAPRDATDPRSGRSFSLTADRPIGEVGGFRSLLDVAEQLGDAVRLDLGGEWEGNTCPSRVQLSLGTNERDPPDAYKAPRAAGLFDRAAIRQWASTHREREGLPVSCPERAFAGRARTSPCAGAGVAARQ